MHTEIIPTAKVAPVTATTLSASENGQDEIRQTLRQWQQALNAHDTRAIVALYAPQAVLLGTLASTPLVTQNQRLHYFEGLVTRPNLRVIFDQEFIQILDESTAIADGTYHFDFDDAGELASLPARFSFVLKKQKNKWQIISHHSSRSPE